MPMTIETLHELFTEHPVIYTDSRKIDGPGIFFALKGERFDGNKYALQALNLGASVAVVDDINVNGDERLVHVADGLETLQKLAAFHRSCFDIPVIGLTGSNGKTTTKELLNAALAEKYKVLYTLGNYNNHLGVPLTLLRLNAEHEIAIIEMGASALNEIGFLSSLARPTEGFITNIGIAHVEGFGSEHNILIGKTELYDYLKRNDGLIYINRADKKLVLALGDYDHYFSYALGELAHSSKNNVTVKASYDGKVKLRVQEGEGMKVVDIYSQLVGDYNATNVAVAVAVALHHGVSLEKIKNGIEHYKPENNRSQVLRYRNMHIILDAYNANPSSMSAAIRSFSHRAGKKALILGSMKELGEGSQAYHEKLIAEIASLDIVHTIFIGSEFPENTVGPVYQTLESLETESVWNSFGDVDAVLLKGSRSWKLENLITD